MFAPTRTFAHDDILWTCTHGGCYATAGVGWGRDDDILWTCTHGGCYATAGVGWGGVGWGWWHSLNLHTWWMLRNCWGGVGWAGDDDILWTCTHGGCYATAGVGWGGVGSGWWHSLNLNTWWMLRTHGGCYATAGVGWGGLGMMTFFELAQEARLANRRCRKRIEAWGSRRKDCMIWAVPRKKGSECGTGKGQGCSEHVSVVKGFPDIQLTS